MLAVDSSDLRVLVTSKSLAFAPRRGQKTNAASLTVVELSTGSKRRAIYRSAAEGSENMRIHSNTEIRSEGHLIICMI